MEKKMGKKSNNEVCPDNMFGIDEAAAKRLLKSSKREMEMAFSFFECYLRHAINRYVRLNGIDTSKANYCHSVIFKPTGGILSPFFVKIWLPRSSDDVVKLPAIELDEKDGDILNMMWDDVTQKAATVKRLSALANEAVELPDFGFNLQGTDEFAAGRPPLFG